VEEFAVEEEMRDEGMRINGDSSPAFIQILLPVVRTYGNYPMRIV
jgi:hypothetical protein